MVELPHSKLRGKIMKTILMTLALSLVASCGNSNNVSSGASANNGLTAPPVSISMTNFEGVYDIVHMGTNDCGASITCHSRIPRTA